MVRAGGPAIGWLASIALLLVVASLLGPGTFPTGTSVAHPGGSPSPAGWAASHATAREPTVGIASRDAIAHPSAPSFSPFFSVNSAVGSQNLTDQFCTHSAGVNRLYNYCYPQTQNPTLVSLGNGNIGLGFSAYTSHNATDCAGSNGATSGRVAFEVSNDGGSSFGGRVYLGNRTCSFLQAIEPSFAVGSSGHVYAAFVEENHSARSYPQLPRDYGGGGGARLQDALGFVNSTDNGTTFGAVRTIQMGGNIARPQVAAFGRSVYVVYENVSNGTVCSGFRCIKPIALWLLYSPDSGNTWRGPYLLPGLGSTWNYTSMSPSIAVNATGTIAVAYATNRSCVSIIFGFCADYGSDIVVAESKGNGTSWAGPVTVAYGAGESQDYNGYFLGQYFQAEPSTSIAYSPSGATLYLAWGGTYNHSTPYVFNNYRVSGVFAATSTNGGSTWRTHPIAANFNATSLDSYFDPSVGAGPTGGFITFTDHNLTTFCVPPCSPMVDANVQWIVRSTNVTQWGAPEFLSMIPQPPGPGYPNSWPGYSSSVLVTATGPRFAYSLVDEAHGTQWVHGAVTVLNFTYATNLSVARPTPLAASIYLNFTASHLPLGARWTVTVNGVSSSSATTYLNVSGIPAHQFIFVNASNLVLSPVHIRIPTLNVPGYSKFNASQTVLVDFSPDFSGVFVSVGPSNIGFGGGAQFSIQAGNDSYFNVGGSAVASPALPWFFPTGSNVSFVGSANPLPPLYWVGTGGGSFSGPGLDANVTLVGPLNETMWVGPSAAANVSFVAPGLPSASQFRFQWNGVTHLGTGGGTTVLTNQLAGGYLLTNISANSSIANWEYFGRSDVPNPVLVPITPLVNLSFADVNLATTPGSISFQAAGAPLGSVWELAFNGTVYSSSTAWINVTEHAGSFLVGGYPFTGGDGVSRYVPAQGLAPLSVTPGNTYSILFTPAYELTVLASGGGHVSPGTQYLAAGTTRTLVASPSNNFAFGGWEGTGMGAYTGPSLSANVTVRGPILEVAQFSPVPLARYNLTFRESGLPSGTAWSVALNGTGFGSRGSSLVVAGLYPYNAPSGRGVYRLSVASVFVNTTISAEFGPLAYPSTVTTNGSTVVNLVFSSRFLLDVIAGVGGSVTVNLATGGVFSPAYIANGTIVQIVAAASSGYLFIGWYGAGTASYSGPNLQPSLTLNSSVSETAAFAPILVPPSPTYTLELIETTPLPAGTTWTAQVGSMNVTATRSSINITGLAPAIYGIVVPAMTSADGQTRYAVSVPISPYHLTHNSSVSFTFVKSFQVVVASTSGGTVPTLTGWFRDGAQLSLTATPDPGNQFVSWVGTGSGAYSGSNLSQNFSVRAPVQEVANFQPTPTPSPSSGSAATSISTWVLVGLGLAFLGLGALILVLPRLRRQDSSRSPEPSEEPPHREEE